DGALLVLEAIRRLDRCGRRDRRASDSSDKLLPQQGAPLLCDISLLSEAGPAQEFYELLAIELTVHLEARILHDAPRALGIGDAKAKRPHALVEQHLADDLLRDLPVDAECPGLLERDRAPELTANGL